MNTIGVVAIGRNEGERLKRCLRSAQDAAGSAGVAVVVYVDSGSTDGSLDAARALGADVVRLDVSTPFTAARARNAGFARMRVLAPAAVFVQFVDGDCELAPRWLETARSFLEANEQAGVVCGRRRERDPGRSVYNRLADDEWNTPVGEARACGGDALMRVAAVAAAGGYRDELIAGEEPELCVRLRALGWRVFRIDAEMTLHDAAMTRFSQWWRRSLRAGFAFAEGARLHGAPPERHWVRESRSAWLWGFVLPGLVVVAVAAFGPVAAWALAIYPLQVARLALRGRGDARLRIARAFFLVLGKFPEWLGQVKAMAAHATRRRAAIIEYK